MLRTHAKRPLIPAPALVLLVLHSACRQASLPHASVVEADPVNRITDSSVFKKVWMLMATCNVQSTPRSATVRVGQMSPLRRQN